METTTESSFEFVLSACIGGAVVLIGLLMEVLSEKKQFKNVKSFRRCESIKCWGEWFVIFGIVIELVVGAWFAKDEWQTIQMAKNNNPLMQPVSQISAILRFEVSAKSYDPKTPMPFENSYMSLAGTGFNLIAKERRYFEHVDNFSTHHVTYYGIVLNFEQNKLPSFLPNDMESTNFPQSPIMTVTNAMSQITAFEAYVDFIPQKTEIVKGTAQIFINGFRKDFQFGSNCVNRAMSEWNPSLPGIFLDVTNSTQ